MIIDEIYGEWSNDERKKKERRLQINKIQFPMNNQIKLVITSSIINRIL